MTTTTKEPKIVTCLFCGNHSIEAEEDLIPLWANRVLKSRWPGGKIDIVLSQRIIGVDGNVLGETTHERRQTYSALRLSGIGGECCNNAWMSQVEQAVAPILSPMLLDKRVGISAFQVPDVTRWLYLKTLTADLLHTQYPTFEIEDYRHFYDTREVPDDFDAWIGRYDANGRDDQFFALSPALTGQSFPAIPIKVKTPYALDFWMNIGSLMIRGRAFNLRTKAYPRPPRVPPLAMWTRLAPCDGEVNWPPPVTISKEMLPENHREWPEVDEWIATNVRGRRGKS